MTSPPHQGFALGVDLGTSNTVAVLHSPDGRTRPLLFDGQPVMPSVVCVDETGHLHVGRDAQRMAQLDPARCEPNPKRRVDERAILLGDREVPVVALLAAILRTVAQAAVQTVGFLPPAVLTCPAAWGAPRREVLLEAVRQAGWPPVRLVPEPVAAARYFAEVLRRPVPVGSAVAVFDFGGGTLDVAVVRNDGDRAPDPRTPFTVISSGGEENLGGLDLDAALVQHLGTLIAQRHPEIWRHLSQPTTTADRRYRRLFWEDVRGAKEMLSRVASAPVPVPGVDQAVHLTRDELERVTGPLVERAVAATGAAIARAGLRPDQLAGLFLVGGSSRVPLAARMLHAQLRIAPTVLEQPELPVAEGALVELAGPAGPATAPADLTGPARHPAGTAPSSGPPSSVGPYPPAAPAPVRRWYRRPLLMVPAVAVLTVLAVVAAVVLLYDPYRERPFRDSLTRAATFGYSGQSVSDTLVAVDGSTAFVADTSQSAQDRSTDDRITVQSFTVGARKTRWKKAFTSPNRAGWQWLLAADGLLLMRYESGYDSSYNSIPGGLVAVDPTNGRVRWTDRHASSDSNDNYELDPGSGVVLHVGADHVTGLDRRSGHTRWSMPGSAALVDTDWKDYDGPSALALPWDRTPGAVHSSKIVVVDGTTAQVVDATTGKKYGHRTVSESGTRMVYGGVLYDASGESGYTVRAYALDRLDAAMWTLPVDQGWKDGQITVCGESLICVTDQRAGSGTSTDDGGSRQIRIVDGGKGTLKRTLKAPYAGSPVPVGNRIVLSYQKNGQLTTQVFDQDGTVQHTWSTLSAARLDDATVLLTNVDITKGTTSSASSSLLEGGGVQSGDSRTIGNVAADLGTCGWTDHYLICPDDEAKAFSVQKFRD